MMMGVSGRHFLAHFLFPFPPPPLPFDPVSLSPCTTLKPHHLCIMSDYEDYDDNEVEEETT